MHPLPLALSLQIPANWAHDVEGLDASISVTHNFLSKDTFNELRQLFLAYKLKRAFD